VSPAPFTVVTFVDDDRDEFPIRLPGVYRNARESDVDAARAIAGELVEHGEFRPNGRLELERVEYFGD